VTWRISTFCAKEKRGSSTAQADAFAGSEREEKASACSGRDDSWLLLSMVKGMIVPLVTGGLGFGEFADALDDMCPADVDAFAKVFEADQDAECVVMEGDERSAFDFF
jgi:hypothetical protein